MGLREQETPALQSLKIIAIANNELTSEYEDNNRNLGEHKVTNIYIYISIDILS